VDKFSKGQSKFEIVLGKAGLGCNLNRKNISVSTPFSSFFEKQPIDLSKQLVVSCFYCMKRGHSVE